MTYIGVIKKSEMEGCERAWALDCNLFAQQWIPVSSVELTM